MNIVYLILVSIIVFELLLTFVFKPHMRTNRENHSKEARFIFLPTLYRTTEDVINTFENDIVGVTDEEAKNHKHHVLKKILRSGLYKGYIVAEVDGKVVLKRPGGRLKIRWFTPVRIGKWVQKKQ